MSEQLTIDVNQLAAALCNQQRQTELGSDWSVTKVAAFIREQATTPAASGEGEGRMSYDRLRFAVDCADDELAKIDAALVRAGGIMGRDNRVEVIDRLTAALREAEQRAERLREHEGNLREAVRQWDERGEKERQRDFGRLDEPYMIRVARALIAALQPAAAAEGASEEPMTFKGRVCRIEEAADGMFRIVDAAEPSISIDGLGRWSMSAEWETLFPTRAAATAFAKGEG